MLEGARCKDGEEVRVEEGVRGGGGRRAGEKGGGRREGAGKERGEGWGGGEPPALQTEWSSWLSPATNWCYLTQPSSI